MDKRFVPSDSFYSVTHKVDEPVKATEAQIKEIYHHAFCGLKGDTLAIAAGFLPVDFNRLCEFDDKAAETVIRARADSEAQISTVLHHNALNGDTKAGMFLTTHLHGWKAAKPENDGSNEIRIVVENALPDPKIEN